MGQGRSDLWTADRVEQLKAFYAEGKFSNAQIARYLGGGLTRNAVISKASRIGLLSQRGPRNSSPRSQAPKAPKAKPDVPRVYAPRVVEVEAPLQIDGKNVTILQLNDRMCKFPIGDPSDKEFHFCGLKPFPGRVYCEAHCRLAYQPIMPRKSAG